MGGRGCGDRRCKKHLLLYSKGQLDEPITSSIASTQYLHMLGLLSPLAEEAGEDNERCSDNRVSNTDIRACGIKLKVNVTFKWL